MLEFTSGQPITHDKALAGILRDTQQYFGFLHGKGYAIGRAESSPQFNGSWAVQLESATSVMYITSDRGHITIEFSRPGETDISRRTSLENLIYSLTDGHTAVGPYRGSLAWGKRKQLVRLSRLLRVYIDLIASRYSSG